MSKLFPLFKHKKAFYLPEFSIRQEALRLRLSSMGVKERVEALINVSKVWTYDYDERKELVQELYDLLPEPVQNSLIDFLSEHIFGQEIAGDIPHALHQVEKEKLLLFSPG